MSEGSKGQRDYPDLRQWCESLLAWSAKLPPVPYSSLDKHRLMVVYLVDKQRIHLHSLLALRESPDTQLVARVMLEALQKLYWVGQHPESRARDWAEYAWVIDWRTLQRRRAEGQPSDPDAVQQIEREVQRLGQRYWRADAKEAARQGQPVPDDPYEQDWTGAPIWRIFKDVNATELYERLYAEWSAWVHSGIGGIGRLIESGNDYTRMKHKSVDIAAASLSMGYACLLGTTVILNELFDLDLKPKLDEYRSSFLRRFGNRSLDDEEKGTGAT